MNIKQLKEYLSTLPDSHEIIMRDSRGDNTEFNIIDLSECNWLNVIYIDLESREETY